MSRPRPRTPGNEAQRLRALRRYGILDTAPESDYDTIAELAAITCGTAIGIIAFVDADRGWAKACHGIDITEVPRKESFCAHAILATELFEVPDTLDDFRFAESPSVVGEPYIRFYAGVPLVTSDGFSIGTLCVADRIPRRLSNTERHALEKFASHVVTLLELRRRKDRLQDLIEGSRDVIFETDGRGCFTFVNRAIHALLGFRPEDVLGRHFTFVVHPDWLDVVGKHYRLQRESRTASTYLEFPCLTQDGAEVWVGQHARAVVRDGEVTAFHAIARDITDLREAESAKREAEKRFEAFMDNSPATALIKDSDGRFVFLNDTLARAIGKPREEVIGMHSSQLLPPDLNQMVTSSEEIVLQHRQTIRVVETFRNQQGDERHWLMHKFPIPGPADSIFLGSFGVDVTDRIALEIDLADARDAAIASARQKSEFLAMMSHEIRTPMNGVLGMLGVLLDSELTADQRDVTETAKFSADSLLTLLNDILDFSKIEAGKLAFEMHDFDVRPTIDGVVDLLADGARSKSLDLRCEIDPSVPMRLRGDAGRVRQVLLNLIGNAVKFTSQGGVRVRLTRESDNCIRFTVSDTGIGIPPDAQKRLFVPFVQADSSTTRRFGGTGLGLAISRRLVEMMNGEIGVESVAGEGSTFWFTARFETAQEPVMTSTEISAPERAAEQRIENRVRSRRGRILVAEDNAVNQKVALRLLEKLGYRADVVANGLEAIEALRRVPYDLVLMDCHMPEMDGYAATRVIRARESRRLPILALTASAMSEDRDRCLQAGMDDVLTKPVREAELEAALNRWMPQEEDAAIDPAAFGQLLELSDGDQSFLRDVIDTYVVQSRELIFGMMQALQRGSCSDFADVVHALNGSSRNVGATKLARICEAAEQRARRGSTVSELMAFVPDIRKAHGSACEILERERPRQAM
jgi:PAS domain S-box-containing protein